MLMLENQVLLAAHLTFVLHIRIHRSCNEDILPIFVRCSGPCAMFDTTFSSLDFSDSLR
jgi:hypothetical protein